MIKFIAGVLALIAIVFGSYDTMIGIVLAVAIIGESIIENKHKRLWERTRKN